MRDARSGLPLETRDRAGAAAADRARLSHARARRRSVGTLPQHGEGLANRPGALPRARSPSRGRAARRGRRASRGRSSRAQLRRSDPALGVGRAAPGKDASHTPRRVRALGLPLAGGTGAARRGKDARGRAEERQDPNLGGSGPFGHVRGAHVSKRWGCKGVAALPRAFRASARRASPPLEQRNHVLRTEGGADGEQGALRAGEVRQPAAAQGAAHDDEAVHRQQGARALQAHGAQPQARADDGRSVRAIPLFPSPAPSGTDDARALRRARRPRRKRARDSIR